ncbi:hypothetical protein D3C80_1027550 [compost metagenome]
MSLLFRNVISRVKTPSTTYSGLLFELAEPKPLIRTVGWLPGVPVLVTVTPATLPCND